MNWNQIINDNEELEQKLIEISNVLYNVKQDKTVGLFNGTPGQILYFFFLWKLFKEEMYWEKGNRLLDDVINKINTENIGIKYSIGLAGVLWVIEFLNRENFISYNIEEACSKINSVLEIEMKNMIRSGNYDFLHGAMGIGAFFVNRVSEEKVKIVLENLVLGLEKISVVFESNSLGWRYKLTDKKEEEAYCLGLAHGVPSIIVFLSKLYVNGIIKNKTKDIIYRAIDFLFMFQNKDPNIESCFPNFIIKNVTTVKMSRLGWCYGDLGIGIALLITAKRMEDKALEEKAISILLDTTKRKELSINGVIDASLCHGTAGIAHIYNRVFQITKKQDFKVSSKFWFDETIKMAKFKDGLAGFKSFSQAHPDGWYNSTGLLEGISGIGLSIISAISEIEPTWDECILLS